MIQGKPLSGQCAVRHRELSTACSALPAVPAVLWVRVGSRRHSLCSSASLLMAQCVGALWPGSGEGAVQCWGTGLTQQHIDLCSTGTLQCSSPRGRSQIQPHQSFLCILLKITLRPTFRKCLCCMRSSKDPLPTKWCFCWSYIEKR